LLTLSVAGCPSAENVSCPQSSMMLSSLSRPSFRAFSSLLELTDCSRPLTESSPVLKGLYPRILDTGCDYAAVGSVAV
jgi:hypothetical protein